MRLKRCAGAGAAIGARARVDSERSQKRSRRVASRGQKAKYPTEFGSALIEPVYNLYIYFRTEMKKSDKDSRDQDIFSC